MRNRLFRLSYGGVLILAVAGPTTAQDNGAQQPSAREQLRAIHSPKSIGQELARLAKDLVNSETAAAGPATACGAP